MEFKKELTYIKNDKYKKSAEQLISLLPNYFYEIAASSTGKYHPEFSLGKGGLLRHTKFAVRIAHELLNNNKTIGDVFNQDEKDLMIISLIMHDGLKSGIEQEKYTRVDHPILICDYIEANKNKINLTDNEIKFINHNIKSHMGEWNTDYKGNEVLEKPKDKYQKFIHMCDFLASRKFINCEFINDEIVDETSQLIYNEK